MSRGRRALRALVHASAHVHPSARLAQSAVVHERAYVGPLCEIGEGSVVGPSVHVGGRTKLHANVTLQNCRVGTDCLLHSGVRIGADGFGFWVDTVGDVHKRPQLLRVLLGDHVEVGAGTCIDRGSWRDTMIGSHTKIDNQVQIGHNVHVGRGCLLCAHAALAGSSELGDYCTLGGKSAVADHITVCDHVRLAACSGVTKHITQCGDYAGLPAQPAQAWRREIASLRAMAAGRGPGRRLESEREVGTPVDDVS